MLTRIVLLFIDNIFRFTQAGSEVSALLGRIPSAVGYQPTLAVDMGLMQERITTTRKGSITSVQAVYVPADDLTDPAPPPLPSLTWTLPLSCLEVFPNSVSTQLSTLSTRNPVSLTPVSSARSTTEPLPEYNRCCKNISRYRTSLPFWVWTNCQKLTS